MKLYELHNVARYHGFLKNQIIPSGQILKALEHKGHIYTSH